jgi:hypothetical protein
MSEPNASESLGLPGLSTSVCSVNTLSSRSSLSAAATSSISPSTPASLGSTKEAESLRRQVKQLEEQLSKATRPSIFSSPATSNTDSQTITTSSRLVGTFYMNHETTSDGHSQPISRFTMHKTRIFGPSHSMSGVAQVSSLGFIDTARDLQRPSSAISLE